MVVLRAVMGAAAATAGMVGLLNEGATAAATINGTRATTIGRDGTAVLMIGGGGRARARAGAGATTGRGPGAAGATTGTGTATATGSS